MAHKKKIKKRGKTVSEFGDRFAGSPGSVSRSLLKSGDIRRAKNVADLKKFQNRKKKRKKRTVAGQ